MVDVIQILRDSEALLTGHFQYSSGLHGEHYVQCAKLLQYPKQAEKVISVIKEKLKGIEFDAIIGPAMGGIIVAYEVGRQTGKKAMFTERKDGEMTLRRGFTIKPGEKILITEDVVTTGKSSMETAKVIEELGGEVVAIACIADRTQGQKIKYPIISATKLDLKQYDPETCPLCRQGLAIEKPGSRPGK